MRGMIHWAVGVVTGLAVLASAQGISERPGTIRTHTSTPIRTGMSGNLRTSAGDLSRVVPGTGLTRGGFYLPAYYTTGTSINIHGDGWDISVNGGLANQLGWSSWYGNRYGFGHRSGWSTNACIIVPDADEFLSSLPENVRDDVHVLRGADYGWDYDILCVPRWTSNGWVYVPVGYGYGWYPSGYTYRDGRMYVNETADWGRLGAPATRRDEPAEQLPPPEPLDLARIGLMIGDLDAAEAQYRAHLTAHPDDSEALREYGLVMLEAERVDEGFAAMRKAYRDKPELADVPLDLRSLGFDGARVRRLMGRVSPVANEIETASGWLTLASLLQSQGKTRAANRMLDKAEAKGLDEPIVRSLRTALNR